MKDAVAFIIEENVPISLAESVFDFEVVSEDGDTGEIKVAVSVLPKNIVSAYVTLFESAGITPISFDLESRAIARAVIHKGNRQPTLIINLSTKKTGFYVVEKGVVQFSTALAYSLAAGDPGSGSKEFLREEMRKVIAFWNAHTGSKIEKIILCGSGGSKTALVDKFMGGSEIPYTTADVWLKMSRSNNYVPEITFGESLGYASAIGLILPRDR